MALTCLPPGPVGAAAAALLLAAAAAAADHFRCPRSLVCHLGQQRLQRSFLGGLAADHCQALLVIQHLDIQSSVTQIITCSARILTPGTSPACRYSGLVVHIQPAGPATALHTPTQIHTSGCVPTADDHKSRAAPNIIARVLCSTAAFAATFMCAPHLHVQQCRNAGGRARAAVHLAPQQLRHRSPVALPQLHIAQVGHRPK